jgi:hypothetical protein
MASDNGSRPLVTADSGGRDNAAPPSLLVPRLFFGSSEDRRRGCCDDRASSSDVFKSILEGAHLIEQNDQLITVIEIVPGDGSLDTTRFTIRYRLRGWAALPDHDRLDKMESMQRIAIAIKNGQYQSTPPAWLKIYLAHAHPEVRHIESFFLGTTFVIAILRDTGLEFVIDIRDAPPKTPPPWLPDGSGGNRARAGPHVPTWLRISPNNYH